MKEMIIWDKIWDTLHWTDGIHRIKIDPEKMDEILSRWEMEGKQAETRSIMGGKAVQMWIK